VTPEAIVARAAAIADAEGISAVTLARLAVELGVRPPSLYKHIESLDAIERALAVRGLQEANRRVQAATVGKSRDVALASLARAYRDFARDHPGLYAASQRKPRAGENDVAREAETLIGTLQAALGGYGLTGADATHAQRGLRAIIHGFVSLEAAGAFRLKADAGETLDRLVAAFAADTVRRAG
jgi:AcrR family transcriptional regulator